MFTQACMRKTEFPTWNSNILTPIATTTIGMNNLVTDSSFQLAKDSSYIFSSKYSLSEIKFDSLIKFTEIPFDQDYTLQKLKLAPQTANQKFSLGDFINQTPYTFINGYNGAMLPTLFSSFLPAKLTQGPLGPYYFNANNFFKSATLLTGKLDLVISNNLPVDLENVTIQFRNRNTSELIFERTNIAILSGGSFTDSEDLAGKVVEGDMEALIPTITIVTDGLKTKIIDTSKSLEFKMTISNVTVSEAYAIFPEQDVINENSFPEFENMAGHIEIKEAVLRSGKVQIDVTSTAQDTLYFDYRIPSLTTNNGEFRTSEKVNAGSVANPAIYNKSFDFENYHLDLSKGRIDKDTVNKINSILDGRIRYSGKLTYLSLKDSLSVHLKIKNLIASSAKGYLGDTLLTISGSTTINNIKQFTNSNFAFDKTSIKLNIANGIGVKGNLPIVELKATNSKTNKTVILTGNAATTIYPVSKAIETPFLPVSTEININQSNSNITELININPDILSYKVTLKLNPLGNDHTYTDFILKESTVKIDSSIEIPLSINIENMNLRDTIDFIKNGIKDIEKIESGKFKLIIENQFPVNAMAKIYLVNSSNMIIDSLISPDIIQAGIVDETGKAINKTHSIIKFDFNKSKLKNLGNATKLLFDADLSTPIQKFVTFYSDYTMDIKLVGDFIYNLDANNVLD